MSKLTGSVYSDKPRLAVDFHENFVQMARPIRIATHPARPVSTDFGSTHRAKSIPSKSSRFVADLDPTLVQQVFDVSERKWKANVHHDRQANDFKAAVKVLEGVRFVHATKLRNYPARLNRYPSDNAHPSNQSTNICLSASAARKP